MSERERDWIVVLPMWLLWHVATAACWGLTWLKHYQLEEGDVSVRVCWEEAKAPGHRSTEG